MTKKVTHSVIVLLMEGIRVKIISGVKDPSLRTTKL